jgi:hypothetical protein
MSDIKRFTIAVSPRQLYTFVSLVIGGFQPKGRTEEETVQTLFTEWKLAPWEKRNGEKVPCRRCGDGGGPSLYEFSDELTERAEMTEGSLRFVINTWAKMAGKTVVAVRVLLPLIKDLENAEKNSYVLPDALPQTPSI